MIEVADAEESQPSILAMQDSPTGAEQYTDAQWPFDTPESRREAYVETLNMDVPEKTKVAPKVAPKA